MKEGLEDLLNQGLYVPISIVTRLRNNVPYLTILNLYKQGKVSGIDISGCPLLVNLDEFPPNQIFVLKSTRYNKLASEWFREFDRINKTKGEYANPETGKGEHYVIGYYLDYINHNLKLIIEWDEDGHYNKDRLKDNDIRRQQRIEEHYSNYLFIRIKQSHWLRMGSRKYDLEFLKFRFYKYIRSWKRLGYKGRS